MSTPSAPDTGTPSAPDASPLDQAFRDLDSNVRAEEIIGRLRDLEPKCQGETREHARLLQARGLALNRLGFDSLGDLQQAADIFQKLGDRAATADLWRAIALVHNWRANAREASLALLRSIAEASEDRVNLARATLETGRLGLEIGRAEEAHRFLLRGLEIGGPDLKISEIRKAQVNALQALVVLGKVEAAQATLTGIDPAGATDRLRHLTLLERARMGLLKGEIDEAERILDEARALLPRDDPENFSHIEQAHVEAEALFAKKTYQEALDRIEKVIGRYFADNLPGREVGARILESKILDALSRRDAADLTLATALQQAIQHQLSTFKRKVLEQLGASGRIAGAWAAGSAPAVISGNSNDLFYGREPLGGGGFGTVESAYDCDSGRRVALKRLRLLGTYDVSEQADRLQAAEMEVAAASRVKHRGVGQVFGLMRETDGEALLVRELIEGETLREAMVRRTLADQDKLGLLANLAYALAAIHAASVVHRDMKPENVVLRDNSPRAPVIIDFGISAIGRVWEGKDAPKTLNYAAPEQMKAGWCDARSDLYSFGVIGYEILVGQLPEAPAPGLLGIASSSHHAKAIESKLAAAGLNGPLTSLIARLLSVSPQQRPSSAQEVASAISAAAEH